MTNDTLPESQETRELGRRELGRNEPCPCGSGKKYKRCHGVASSPKLSHPRALPTDAFGNSVGNGAAPAMPPGMENINPERMAEMASMLQRLPKGQLQRLQSIMQRAMSGKDVAQEAEAFQKMLPPEFQQMLMSMAPAAALAAQANAPQAYAPQASPSMTTSPPSPPGSTRPESGTSSAMSEEEARRIVEEAVASGKLSADEAAQIIPSSKEAKGLSKLWRSFSKK